MQVEMFVKMFEMEIYASQTTILETETAGRACLFEALCEGVSTRFGLRMLTKSLEKTRSTRCFVFQNLRLGSINLPARPPVGQRVDVVGQVGMRLRFFVEQ